MGIGNDVTTSWTNYPRTVTAIEIKGSTVYDDTDMDGVPDVYEITNGTNPNLIDTDNDNFLDGYEIDFGSDPLNATDFPPIWQADFDYLSGLLQDNWTLLNITIGFLQGNWTYLQSLNDTVYQNMDVLTEALDNVGADGLADFDGDGLADIYEIGNGTDPGRIDSDNDNFLDYYEILQGSDPTNPLDVPKPSTDIPGFSPLLVGTLVFALVAIIIVGIIKRKKPS